MPRLKNKVTGAVMSVSDAVAANLGSEWIDADKAAEEPVKRASRTRKTDN